MKVVVCVKQTVDGELNPFDACAYEAALQIENSEVTLLSMCPASASDFMLNLTRLGAKQAVLLTDKAFAGADTLATSYTLSLALKKISPDLVICGRQTVDGDTGQVGIELAVMMGYSLITNVMSIEHTNNNLCCSTRNDGQQIATYPALITIERINTLRLPALRSKTGEIQVWDAKTLGADISRCGLGGSPTRVLKTFDNLDGRRKCVFIQPDDLSRVIKEGLQKNQSSIAPSSPSGAKLKKLLIVGESPREFAQTVSEDIIVLSPDTPSNLAKSIKKIAPSAVLWGSDSWSKKTAPQVAAILQTGLCADCTQLETDGETLFMYRPAFSGNVIAKIKCTTHPAMATVRTVQTGTAPIIIGVGYGARDFLENIKAFAASQNAELAATRKMVDNDFVPYEVQVGLTGRTVSPAVYLAVGISGAVHHLAGIRRSGTIIAINPDKDAPIFNCADYGILKKIEDVL